MSEHLKFKLLLIIAFCLIIILDFSTPPPYVFGYLYIAPILLANYRLNRQATKWVAIFSVLLTILNLFFPGIHDIKLESFVNRFLVAIALLITAFLSDQNRHYHETLTRQKLQLESEQQLASLREDFASTLTHDLKTPLLGGIETIKAFESEKFGPVTLTQRKVLNIMIRSHRNTLQLVETLLDVYRNDTQGLQIERQPLDLLPVAEMAITSLTELASTRSVYIHLGAENTDFRQSCWVNGDEFQLGRVFVNLLTNAINHSIRGGKVNVIFSNGFGYHVVKIVDQGLGITQEELPLLFERFYQGHGDRSCKGTGLGLYLCRQIIEAHGGKIWAEQGLPKGAVFAFSVPCEIV